MRLIVTLLHHPAENPNITTRANAGLAVDGDIPALGENTASLHFKIYTL